MERWNINQERLKNEIRYIINNDEEYNNLLSIHYPTEDLKKLLLKGYSVERLCEIPPRFLSLPVDLRALL